MKSAQHSLWLNRHTFYLFRICIIFWFRFGHTRFLPLLVYWINTLMIIPYIYPVRSGHCGWITMMQGIVFWFFLYLFLIFWMVFPERSRKGFLRVSLNTILCTQLSVIPNLCVGWLFLLADKIRLLVWHMF